MKTRRTFIKTAGVAATGMAIMPSCSTSGKKEQETPEAIEQVTMTTDQPKKDIGLQIYTVRNQINEDLEGTITSVAEAGYNQVEVFGYNNRQFFGRSASDFYQLLEDNGLKCISGHHPTGISQPDVVGSLLNGFEYAIEDAISAGQQYIVMPYLTEDERTLETYKSLPELLSKAGEQCKEAGLQLCYHNHDFEFVEVHGMMPMYHILDQTDPELLKMELDLYWIVKAGFDPIAFFEKYPGRTALWHVKDMADTPEKSFAEVGTGTIDFETIFANREKAGLAHFFVEQDEADDPLKSIRISYENVSKLA